MRKTSRKHARSHKHSHYKTQGDGHASSQVVLPTLPVFRALGRIEQVGGGRREEGNIFPSKPRKLRYMWNSFSKISWGWRIFEANPTVCESVPGGGRH